MKVSGCTFVRNAIKYDYPVKESILSILPIVNEMIIVVGNSEDDTLSLIQSISSPKIKIVHSVWNENLRQGGAVLADETNKALDAVSEDSEWVFYLQGDEVVHEKYYQPIQAAMEKYLKEERVEGLLFHYKHFYGSYKYIGDARRWYSKEIRIVRNDNKIRSWKDAQGFRKENKKLHVKLIDAYIYHYGWVKSPQNQQSKQKDFYRWWNDDNWQKQWLEKKKKEGELFNYQKHIDSLTFFNETHPASMQERVQAEDWNFKFDINKKNFKNPKYYFLYILEKYTGWRPFEYSNYKKI